MGKKKIKAKETEFSPTRIFGIVDLLEKKMIKVSLDETEIDLDTAFLDKTRYYKCVFTIKPMI